MSNQDEVTDIIDQLRQLQLRQAELLTRLDQLCAGDNPTGRFEIPQRVQAREQNRSRGVIVAAGGFSVGDQVEVLNPSPGQASRGVIKKIGNSWITIEAEDGSKIIRTPKNFKVEV